LFPSHAARRWTNQEHCFLAMLLEGEQTRKHCFLAMLLEGEQIRKGLLPFDKAVLWVNWDCNGHEGHFCMKVALPARSIDYYPNTGTYRQVNFQRMWFGCNSHNSIHYVHTNFHTKVAHQTKNH
jgi:hypothetical protein